MRVPAGPGSPWGSVSGGLEMLRGPGAGWGPGCGAPGTNGTPLCAGEVHGQAGPQAGQPG